MKKIWTAYDHGIKKIANIIEPEPITLADGQKAIMGESSETGKILYKIISSEEAKTLLENE